MKTYALSKAVILTVIFFTAAFCVQSAKASNDEVASVAINGYDAVAYFEDGKAMPGDATHMMVYNGSTYLFANEDHQKLFSDNPEKYLPQFGGFCAMGVAMGKKFYVDPEAWKIVDGKLYLNLNKEVQKAWMEDMTGNIEKANENWDSVKDSAPAKL